MVEQQSQQGWTEVKGKKTKRPCWNVDIEFAVELLPAYKDGVARLVDHYGIDTFSERTVNNYCQPYLYSQSTSPKMHIPRKVQKVPQESSEKLLQDGFINVAPHFLHSTLMYVNPPCSMDDYDTASKYIVQEMSSFLENVADTNAPELTFTATTNEGEAAGRRKVYFIKSDTGGLPQQSFIEQLRGVVSKMFLDHGFKVRFPAEHRHEVHMTIRDERYETHNKKLKGQATRRRPTQKGSLRLVFDKLAVTPAAEVDARHDFKRQYCGATLCLNIFKMFANCISGAQSGPKCFLHGTHFLNLKNELIAVEDLQCGELLLQVKADEEYVEVHDVRIHEPEKRDIAEICTARGSLLITADHRIVILRGVRHQTIPAGHLRQGDAILCDDSDLEAITSICMYAEEVRVFQVTFKPDVAMKTFYMDGSILTKGSKLHPYTTRRSGMCKSLTKWPPSIPNTDDPFL
jgi:hypothetical protein